MKEAGPERASSHDGAGRPLGATRGSQRSNSRIAAADSARPPPLLHRAAPSTSRSRGWRPRETSLPRAYVRRGGTERSPGNVYGAPSPPRRREVTIGVLSCEELHGQAQVERRLWFPHADVARHVAAHEPDLLYFAGDQIYEEPDPTVRAPSGGARHYLAVVPHGWSFGDLTRRLPTVVVTDDTTYHGTSGATGRTSRTLKQDRGVT